MIISIERLPADYDCRHRFPTLRRAGGSEGATFYIAEEAGASVLIVDESTTLELIGEYNDAITVRHFASNEDRNLFLSALLPNASFKTKARLRQAQFRSSLAEAAQGSDHLSRRHGFLLGTGAEDENLFPSLRGPAGARAYCRARGIRWWRNPKSGDPAREDGPTRNMTSSQIACVNLFLPLSNEPELLTAMLRALDPDIDGVAPVPFTSPNGQDSSLIELEWTGRVGTLEGSGSRGMNATSADACLIGVTGKGVRRLYLIECKYTEDYTTGGAAKGVGPAGKKRETRYADRYARAESSFNGAAPLTDLLYEPFYQIVRLGLLADSARADAGMEIAETRVVVVCPEENAAYRNGITSPALAKRFPDEQAIEGIARRLWRDPRCFSVVDPRQLVEAVRSTHSEASREWGDYLSDRYGW